MARKGGARHDHSDGGVAVAQGQTQQCPACGRAIERDWKHCVFCGATLGEGCPKCGAPRLNVAREAFCHACGAPLEPQQDAPTVPLEDHEAG
jgi:Double zinc ribbon